MRPRRADFTLQNPELDDRSFRSAGGRAMYDSKKLDLIEDPKAASLAAAMAPWFPGSSIVAAWWRRFARDVVKPYRPELHYMRGPGPKWREKHGSRAR